MRYEITHERLLEAYDERGVQLTAAQARIRELEADRDRWRAEAMAAREFLEVVEYVEINRVDVLTFAQGLTKRRAYAAARAANEGSTP